MTKKRLIIIGSVVAAVIVVMSLIGVAVFADSPTPTTGTGTNPQSVFAAKVAGILGIEQAEVEAAFIQAQKEMRSEAETKILSDMVASGKLTQEQADQYKNWMNSRPDVPGVFGPGGMQGGMLGPGFHCPRGGSGGRFFKAGPPPLPDLTTTN